MKNQALNAVVIFFYLLSFYCFEGELLAQNGEWAVFNKQNSSLPDNTVFSVKVDKEQNIWAGTWNGGIVFLIE